MLFTANAQDTKIPDLAPQFVKIPINLGGLFSQTVDMTAELFKPDGQGPYPVLVYSHGRSSTAEERANIKEVIPRDYLRFWLARGFAVVAPMRPGYGKTGGADREAPGHAWDNKGNCTRLPNFGRTVDAGSQAKIAAIEWVQKQAWSNPSAILITGNSVGGVTTVAVGSKNIAGVIGFINFAGGIGGNPSLSPGKSCDPNQLRDMFRSYGRSAKIPSLWIYAENDLLWGSDAPKAWHAAFAEGGSPTQLVTTASVPNQDGHDLIFFGKDLWTAHVDSFVTRLGY